MSCGNVMFDKNSLIMEKIASLLRDLDVGRKRALSVYVCGCVSCMECEEPSNMCVTKKGIENGTKRKNECTKNEEKKSHTNK